MPASSLLSPFPLRDAGSRQRGRFTLGALLVDMLFVTLILLVLVPCLYLMLEGLRERWEHQTHAPPTQEPTR